MRPAIRCAWLAVTLSAASAAAAGCEAIVTDVSVTFLLPEDETVLAPTNNVSIVTSPNGFSESFSAQGPDFEVEIELEPDDTARTLSVFMAQNETLLGYGITPPFSFSAASGVDLRVFISFPGTLTSYPMTFAVPDASTRAAVARQRGMVALGGDGETVFLDAYTLQVLAGEPLVSARGLPDPEDGVLFGNAQGNVDRLIWNDGLSGFRFNVLTNVWEDLDLAGAVSFGVRPDAIGLGDDDGTRYHLLGGGDRIDALSIALSEDGQPVVAAPWELDRPRPGANAMWLRIGERDPEPLVFGSADDDAPAVWLAGRREATGPVGRWTQGRCIQLDLPTADPVRVLCVGGVRGDVDSADAVVLAVGAIGPVVFEERVDFLPTPMPEPLWLDDERAVYAQGEARLVRVARDTLVTDEPPASVLRARGGQTVSFDTTVTFLVGGLDVDGLPVQQWQVFTPDVR